MVISTDTLARLVAALPGSRRNGASSSFSGLNEQAMDRRAWYTVLLHQTLGYAEQAVPFYRDQVRRGRPPAAEFRRCSDLARFPVVTKADVARDLAAFVSEAARRETVHCTSGTTAQRLHIYGNRDEELAQALLSHIRSSAPARAELALRVVPGPRRLYSPTHPGLGGPALVLGYSSNQDNHQWYDYTDYLAEVLNSRYLLSGRTSRISVVHITPPWMLEFITRKFVDRGIDPSSFGVRLVGISGGFSTARSRKFIEDTWGAAYTSSYSCSEVASGEALEDRRLPGVYRPGPSLYCEVVDPDSFEPVAPGEHGLVLVTSLYPFQQVMPFIRYNTGDIAERIATDDGHGSDDGIIAFRPIGRMPDCLRLGQRHFFGTREVLEALSPFDEVPQVPCPRYRLTSMGPVERPSISLSVETVEMSDAKRQRLRAEILKRLCAHYQAVPAARGRAVTFTCDLVRKGELRDHCRLVPDR